MELMRREVKAVLAAVAVLVTIPIVARAQREREPVILWLSGSGSATENDRGSADSEALNQATSQVNAECVGEVEIVETTSDNCVTLGGGGDTPPSYSCVVLVKGKCVVHRR